MALIINVESDEAHRIFEGTSCAMGVFDGVHCGHQYLIGQAVKAAKEAGGRSVVLTFDKDPDELFSPEKMHKLMLNEDRIALLEDSGVDEVIVFPFTRQFAALEPRDFLERTFNGHAPDTLHVGFDFRFGAKASGTVADLRLWGGERGTRIFPYELESADGIPISSTRIRGLLEKTELEKANELLGHPYFVRAQVRHGRGEGKELGFSTANLKLAPQLQTLGDGVYAGYAYFGEERYKAAISFGISPTFADSTDSSCEAHLLDFSGELYGVELRLEFLHFLRPLIRFNSQEELVRTVLENIDWVRTHL